ncbi:hypothetical protein [Vagococcus sp. CY52-2]|uniref:hypothetical protein n=1 Tax=Vagococcus sp. CY52-2 TaxID=2925838 RepID=UPI001F59337D|nr:hypothetical protein [Vagococcus sp. CY52-2]UNM90315.1 hypothetical protein MN187_04310 [Vagococcus sp. CY52-2]
MHDWNIVFDNKYADYFTLMTNDQYVSIICLKTQFGEFSPIMFELTDVTTKLMNQPHFVESITMGLDKVITIEMNDFFGFQDLEENQIEG